MADLSLPVACLKQISINSYNKYFYNFISVTKHRWPCFNKYRTKRFNDICVNPSLCNLMPLQLPPCEFLQTCRSNTQMCCDDAQSTKLLKLTCKTSLCWHKWTWRSLLKWHARWQNDKVPVLLLIWHICELWWYKFLQTNLSYQPHHTRHLCSDYDFQSASD